MKFRFSNKVSVFPHYLRLEYDHHCRQFSTSFLRKLQTNPQVRASFSGGSNNSQGPSFYFTQCPLISHSLQLKNDFELLCFLLLNRHCLVNIIEVFFFPCFERKISAFKMTLNLMIESVQAILFCCLVLRSLLYLCLVLFMLAECMMIGR